MRFGRLLCLDDFEAEAQKHLPKSIFGYIAGAAETNFSVNDNRSIFNDLAFVPRILRNVSTASTGTTLWGETYAAPFGLAPMGLSAIFAYRGDCVMAQAAQACNIPMIMSGSSLIQMEEVAKLGKNIWFQAYLPGRTDQITALIERVANAGYKNLVITVDTPVAANRENNTRTGFSIPLRPSASLLVSGLTHPRWLFGTVLKTLYKHGMPYFENSYASRGAPILSRNVLRDFSDRGHLDWEHFKLIRKLWSGKLIIKGVVSSSDALLACEHGADGLIISNHGGRQLDGTLAPLRVLPEIVQACPNILVMMDGGIRRGTDIVKALALGAKFVFVGRPFAYAAAIGGTQGVRHAIELLSSELKRNMGLLGMTKIEDIDKDCIRALSMNSVFSRYTND